MTYQDDDGNPTHFNSVGEYNMLPLKSGKTWEVVKLTLTPTQEFEMYSDIKVIKNNCLICRAQIKDLEKRIKFLENKYWIFYGIGLILSIIFPLGLQYIFKNLI